MREDKPEARLESAKRLRAIRQKRKMSQEKFAEMLNISVSAYKKIESGENNISTTNLRTLKNCMGISADYLLFGQTSDFEQIWSEIGKSPDSVKLKLFLRMCYYFCNREEDAFNNESQKDIEKIITRWMGDIHTDEYT